MYIFNLITVKFVVSVPYLCVWKNSSKLRLCASLQSCLKKDKDYKIAQSKAAPTGRFFISVGFSPCFPPSAASEIKFSFSRAKCHCSCRDLQNKSVLNSIQIPSVTAIDFCWCGILPRFITTAIVHKRNNTDLVCITHGCLVTSERH